MDKHSTTNTPPLRSAVFNTAPTIPPERKTQVASLSPPSVKCSRKDNHPSPMPRLAFHTSSFYPPCPSSFTRDGSHPLPNSTPLHSAPPHLHTQHPHQPRPDQTRPFASPPPPYPFHWSSNKQQQTVSATPGLPDGTTSYFLCVELDGHLSPVKVHGSPESGRACLGWLKCVRRNGSDAFLGVASTKWGVGRNIHRQMTGVGGGRLEGSLPTYPCLPRSPFSTTH